MIATERATIIYNCHKPDEIRAVSEVSLTIDQGVVVVLKGPSGSGKTSLLSLIGCMSRPTSGKVIIQDKDVAKLPERFLAAIRRQTFGFIFQQFNLIRDISVLENVTLPLYPIDGGFQEMRNRAEQVLDRLGLMHKIKQKVSTLSGGEQQRVAVARALISDPEIIIADEPTAHLDRTLSLDLLSILQKLNSEGKTVVIATHDPLVYDHPLVTQTVEMLDGRVEEVKFR
jgi:putative ABC transport system ATP-binding protein